MSPYPPNDLSPAKHFDVVIAGAGLAGLGLARQLHLANPGITLAIIDPLSRPLPHSAFKVGESTVEIGANYLLETLQLKAFLSKTQLKKFGVRYFLGPGEKPLHQRLEWGTDVHLPIPSYQLDRGQLENHLRDLVDQQSNTVLLEGSKVLKLELGSEGALHHVECVGPNKVKRHLNCRWLIDAMGRRRMLQRQLKLHRDSPHHASSVWFRVAEKIDIESLVPTTETAWLNRTPAQHRILSTNHLMGHGYWIWIIPLSSGWTSIGLVTDETIHPYSEYASFTKMLRFIQVHEPHFYQRIQALVPQDFKGLRNFSYKSKRMFSENRWACVGESGAFLDPFYSPGTDMIGIANTITTQLICADFNGQHNPKQVKRYNRFFRGFVDTFMETYNGRYPIYGNAYLSHIKIMWDTCLYWVWTGQIVFRGLLKRPQSLNAILEYGIQFSILHQRVQEVLLQWVQKANPTCPFRWVTPYAIPLFRELHDNLGKNCTDQEVLDRLPELLALFEEWAILLFREALASTHPELHASFEEPFWVNAWAISLEPEKWQEMGLMRPASSPRTFDRIRLKLCLSKAIQV